MGEGMSAIVGAIFEYVTAGMLLGFAVSSGLQKRWFTCSTSFLGGLLLLFLGLDIQFNFLRWG